MKLGLRAVDAAGWRRYTPLMYGAGDYRVLDASALGELDPQRELAFDVLVGLSEQPKKLPSKYLYDDEGSRYFQRIMALEEYYPTRCETEILERHGGDLVARVAGAPLNLVDLGAGDGEKTLIVLRHLMARGIDFTYVPIDISEGAMTSLLAKLERELPGVPASGLVCDYSDGLAWLSAHGAGRRNLVLFLGSNIGNFNRVQARLFLRRIWTSLRQDDLLFIGFDMKKDIEVLLSAYNDRHGVTAGFNLNLLARINRELGGGFELSRFRHFATYDVFSGAMESYLVSLEEQVVPIEALGQSFHFDPWEPIHTEYSYKYLDSDVKLLAADTGFKVRCAFRDEKGYFADALWQVDKRG